MSEEQTNEEVSTVAETTTTTTATPKPKTATKTTKTTKPTTAKPKNRGGRPKGSKDTTKRKQKHLSGITRPPASRTKVKGAEIPNDPQSLAALIQRDKEEELEDDSPDTNESQGEVFITPEQPSANQFMQQPLAPPKIDKVAAEQGPLPIMNGGHPREPVIIRRHEREVFSWLEDKFRPAGGYFVLSEQTSTQTIRGRVLKRKCVCVEDGNGFRYHIWFDLTALSLI